MPESLIRSASRSMRLVSHMDSSSQKKTFGSATVLSSSTTDSGSRRRYLPPVIDHSEQKVQRAVQPSEVRTEARGLNHSLKYFSRCRAVSERSGKGSALRSV